MVFSTQTGISLDEYDHSGKTRARTRKVEVILSNVNLWPGQEFLATHLHRTPGMFHQTDRGQSTLGSEHTGKLGLLALPGPAVPDLQRNYGVNKLKEGKKGTENYTTQ